MEARRAPTEINSYSGVKAVDLNGDGHSDIVAANATSELQGGIQVWWGTGKGSWVPGPSPTVTGIYMDVLAADVNGDGVLDLVGAGWGNPGGIRVWLGNGAGGWSALDPFCRGSVYALGAADFDADGRLDLVAGSYKGYVRLFRGDGRGGFTEETALKADPAGEGAEAPTPDASYWQALPVDLDGDGWVDLVAGSLDNQGVHAWFNRQGKGWAFRADAFPRSGNFTAWRPATGMRRTARDRRGQLRGRRPGARLTAGLPGGAGGARAPHGRRGSCRGGAGRARGERRVQGRQRGAGVQDRHCRRNAIRPNRPNKL